MDLKKINSRVLAFIILVLFVLTIAATYYKTFILKSIEVIDEEVLEEEYESI